MQNSTWKKLVQSASFCTLLAITPVAALAIEAGWYVGAGGGQSSIKDFEDACDPFTVDDYVFDIASCDDEDTAWKAFAGYQFNPNWAFEVGYLDLGEGSLKTGVVVVETTEISAKANWEADGINFMAVGSYPVNDMFSLSAKAGGFWWEADAKATVYADGEAIGSYSDDDGKVDFGYGLGARVDFNENLAARVEWEKYLNVGGDEHTGESDVDVISASILFKF